MESGQIRGGSFSAYHLGSLVVDVMGGAADAAAQRLWQPDTVTVIMSVSKAVAAICAALLVKRYFLCCSVLYSKNSFLLFCYFNV